MRYFAIILLCLFVSCKTRTIQVPVETVKTEYIDRLHRDSIYIQDSVFVKMQGDTIWLERYKTIYKEKLRTDTLRVVEIKEIPYEVQLPPIEKKVYPRWLIIMACVGGVGLGYLVFRLTKIF